MKKIATLIATVLMATTIVACGAKNEGESGTGSEAPKKKRSPSALSL